MCRGFGGATLVLLTTDFAIEDDRGGSKPLVFDTVPHLPADSRTHRTSEDRATTATHRSPIFKRSLICCCDFKLAQASYTPI